MSFSKNGYVKGQVFNRVYSLSYTVLLQSLSTIKQGSCPFCSRVVFILEIV